MGAGDIESLAQQNAELAATKPRERQFQVVPMPGVFTRGRWKCWDYYPESKEESQTDKKEKDVAAEKEKSEVTTTVVVPETVPVTTSPVDIPNDNNMVDGGANKENTPAIAEAVTTAETTPVKGDRESSTILVTSVAPAPATPQHGTPQSISGSLEHYVDSPLNTVASAQSDVTLASGSTKPVMSNAVEENNAQQQLTGRTTPVPQQPLNPAAPSQSTTGGAQPNSTLRQISGTESTPTDEEADGSSGNGISKAAIDNKIEQAMDLVKTHLTFAVREEVETLRVTIAELELKVASLESENQLLRQYAPVEVVSQLPSLVQQQKSTTAPPQPSAATLPLSPPKVPAGFCSSTFATTLNNVVGDVRQEMAMAAQNNTQQHEQEGGN